MISFEKNLHWNEKLFKAGEAALALTEEIFGRKAEKI